MELTCNTCGSTFYAKRSDAQYCSPRCRTQASRDRNQPDRPKAKRRPLTDQFSAKMVDLRRTTEALERLSKLDRMSRNTDTITLLHRADLQHHITSLENVLSKLQ